MRLTRLAAGCSVLLTLGCAPPAAPAGSDVAETFDALRGGSADADGGLPDVFMVRMRFNTGQQYVCTATLITSRTLLTAAHCFDPAAAPAGNTTLTDVWVQNGTPAPPSSSAAWVRIDPARTRMHPMWSAGDRLSYDVAAALLPTASAVRPSPHQARALTAASVGTPMTVAGFGITAAGQTDFGTRRVATLPLRGLTAKHLQLGNMSSTGICNGDSGGPSFLTGRDGVRRVVGVHSYDSSLQCNDGLDTRVDLFATAFVQQFIRDEEGGPTCFEDGLCATGCPSADVDCFCQADGTCNGQCPNLLTDPDCPADCVANGVCATQACPVLDPDCRAELAACTAAAQCQYRECVTDPQRPGQYCSRPCTAGCPGGTQCVGTVCLQPQRPTADAGASCDATGTFCLGGTACTGFTGEALTCRATCTSDASCGSPGDCAPAQNGQQLCRPVASAGQACTPDVTLCTGATDCSGFAGEATTCRPTCQSAATCPPCSDCVAAQGGLSLCLPTAQPGEDCVANLTRCLGGTACTGLPGEALACRPTCASEADCGATERCVDGEQTFKVCAAQPIVLDALGEAASPAGCATGPAAPFLVLAVVGLRRRRQR